MRTIRREKPLFAASAGIGRRGSERARRFFNFRRSTARRCLGLLLLLGLLCPLRPAGAGVVLALSGGGTKGFAHIGVIEALEENGVPVIGIVGTSMGALIGALRASGYSTEDMRRIVGELDLPSLLSENTGPMFVFTGDDKRAKTSTVSALTYKKNGKRLGPLGILTGDKLYQFFAQLMRHVSVTDFYHLPIPYAAVATDINTGERVVLSGGNLASAMRASMSIPALFEPWEINGRFLVDGGVVSNLPVYTAHELFPGLPVVAVDISDNLSTEAPVQSYVDVINQSLTILMRRTTNEEGAAADVLITPQVQNFGMLDAGHSDQIIAAGREAALQKIEEVKALSAQGPDLFTGAAPESVSDIVGDIQVVGLPEKVGNDLRKRYLNWVGKPVAQREIDNAIERLSGSPGIAMADYQLGETESGDILVRLDVRPMPELELGISGYTTNLHKNRWLYLKGTARGLLSDYDSLSGVVRLGEQWGADLSYQTAPAMMNAWQFNLAAQKWKLDSNAGERDWNRYAVGASRLFQWGTVTAGLGMAYEHTEGGSVSGEDATDSVGPTFFAAYDTLDIPGDPTQGYAWRVNAWWPRLDEINYRFTYFKPLEVAKSWRTYFRLGYAEGDMNRRGHAAYLGAAEELYTAAAHPVEAERMVWTNLAVRRILNRNVLGIAAAELFASYGYAMDKEYKKISDPWEVGLAVNFPNNLIDVKLAAMYGSEEFKVGFFIGVPIWDHYPLP
ncbi:MAG: patatin-like phospholipase family protein [Fretibacterium sp.]|nr:patatin-like phospholipase family protein [Fretibacterium sp.]